MNSPNIILLILDTVRAQNMACYGYPKPTTPHMDELAANNVLFKRAYTTSTWTIPTHASLLSGLYLSEHRIENLMGNRSFHANIVTLPKAVKKVGYTTAGFSQNILFSPLHHFSDFDEFYTHDQIIESHYLGRYLGKRSANTKKISVQVTRYLRKTLNLGWFLQRIRKWVTQSRSQPFFLMANLTHSHSPWAPALDVLIRQLGKNVKALRNVEMIAPKAFQFNSGKRSVTPKHREVWEQLYNASLIHMDRVLGQFFRQLGQWAGWENTVLAITADHGEMLGDYRNFVGHMLTLNDRILHIPLILKHPDYKQGRAVEGVVQLHDLYPTIVDWLKIPDIPPSQLQRPSLEHALTSPSSISGLAFAEEDYTESYDVIKGLKSVNPQMAVDRYPRRQVAVHAGTHKLIWKNDRAPEFFRIDTDPNESHNLATSDNPVDQVKFEELQTAREKWEASLGFFPPQQLSQAQDMDADMVARLRALGYLA